MFRIKRMFAIAIALCVCLTCLVPIDALAAEKSEIVYANLRSDGTLERVYVVNRFESDMGESVVDYGAYYEVTNLTDMSELELLSDAVRLTVPQGTLFYEGDPIASSLPWSFSVEYLLDGAPARAESLGGATGALEIRFSIGKGSETYADFYEHYALTMTITLDGEKCRDLVAESATVANSGTDRLLNYTILPSPEKTYVITANVTDFSMPDIQINAVPLGMDVDIDTSEISDKMSALQSGISQLDSGSAQVADGAAQLQSGTTTLAEGADALVTGAQEFSAGLDEAKAGSSQLAAASSQIITAIDGFDAQIGDADISIAQLRSVCEKLLAVVDALESQLDTIDGNFGGISTAAASYLEASEQIVAAISQMEFSDSDISTLNTLLSRSSQSADVTTYLAAEISALRRILDKASDVNSQLDALSGYAQTNLSKATELSAQISGMTSGIGDAHTRLGEVRASLEAILALLDGMEQSGASADDGVLESLFSMIHQMDNGIQALDGGISQLQTSFVLLNTGIASVDTGVDSLAEGADTLLTGANSLSSGAGELDSSTSNMDSQLEEGVDDAVSSITGGDYTPVSYMDARNDVELVQFVIRIPGIEEAEEPEPVVEEEPERNFLEKLIDLFQ